MADPNDRWTPDREAWSILRRRRFGYPEDVVWDAVRLYWESGDTGIEAAQRASESAHRMERRRSEQWRQHEVPAPPVGGDGWATLEEDSDDWYRSPDDRPEIPAAPFLDLIDAPGLMRRDRELLQVVREEGSVWRVARRLGYRNERDLLARLGRVMVRAALHA